MLRIRDPRDLAREAFIARKAASQVSIDFKQIALRVLEKGGESR